MSIRLHVQNLLTRQLRECGDATRRKSKVRTSEFRNNRKNMKHTNSYSKRIEWYKNKICGVHKTRPELLALQRWPWAASRFAAPLWERLRAETSLHASHGRASQASQIPFFSCCSPRKRFSVMHMFNLETCAFGGYWRHLRKHVGGKGVAAH